MAVYCTVDLGFRLMHVEAVPLLNQNLAALAVLTGRRTDRCGALTTDTGPAHPTQAAFQRVLERAPNQLGTSVTGPPRADTEETSYRQTFFETLV